MSTKSFCICYFEEVKKVTSYGRSYEETVRREIPLKKVTIRVEVRDQLAQFTVVQSFSNTEDKPIEASYTFPTPAYATVYDFVAKIADRVIKGELQEKETAKKNYNKAVSEGHGAYLAERQEGDVFSVALGNVPAKTDVELTLKYAVALESEIDATHVLLELPMSMMPRYAPKTENPGHARAVNPDTVSYKPYDVSISGTVYQSSGIVSLDSKVSKIKVSNVHPNSWDFAIENPENINESFFVSIERKKPDSVAHTEVFPEKLTDETLRFCTKVNIVPNFSNVEKPKPEDLYFVFLIDRSGSMDSGNYSGKKASSNSPMAKAIEGTALAVSMLPIGADFDIIAFDSEIDKYEHPKDVAVGSPESKKLACEWVGKLFARGSTEIYPALQNVYETIKAKNKSGVVILLTDGDISNVEETVRLVKANPNVNVFTLGIGENVSTQLVESLAKEGRGRCERVTTDDIKVKMIAQLSRAQQSARRVQQNNEVKIEVEGKYRLVPEQIPALYEGDNNVFYIFSEQPVKSVQYCQKMQDHDIVRSVPVEMAECDGFPIHRVAGIRLIESLIAKKPGSQLEGIKEDVHKDEIVQISTDLGIMSKFTSFLAVEYRENKDKVLERAEVRYVPLQLPRAYYESAPRGMMAACCAPSGGMLKSKKMSGGGGARMMDKCMFGGGDSYGEECAVLAYDSGNSGDSDNSDDDRSIPESSRSSVSVPVPKYTISVPLPACTWTTATVLMGLAQGLFPFPIEINDGDVVEIKLSNEYDGLYRVVSLGSEHNPWVFEKLN